MEKEGSEKEGALPLRLFKCEAFGCLRRRHVWPSHLHATRIGISVNKPTGWKYLAATVSSARNT